MSLTTRFLHFHASVSEQDADRLQTGLPDWHTVAVHPPSTGDTPATLSRFIGTLLELQTTWLGWKNASPVMAFELRRPNPGTLRLQYTVPTTRLERKLRTQLPVDVPDIDFGPGTDGLPVSEGDAIGGGILTTGREDWYPLRTDFDDPPMNAVVAALHRDAMRDTRFVIQLLFQPVAGRPLRSWWRRRNAYKRLGYLRKEKPDVFPWHDRPATPRERTQADTIEHKMGNPQFHVSIRILVIGAGDDTRSRVKEVSGAFNTFENADTGQHLNTWTVKSLFPSRLIQFADAVRHRRFAGWALRFHASQDELAGLVSIPNRPEQRNIQGAES